MWGGRPHPRPDSLAGLEFVDPVPDETQLALAGDPRVHLPGADWDTAPLYLAMDLFCLPSHREGFPNVLLEAAAMPDPGPPSVSLLPPLDPLMWDRRLVKTVFGFDYIWEVYVPAPKRRHGYYVLPILFGSFYASYRDVPTCSATVLAFFNCAW